MTDPMTDAQPRIEDDRDNEEGGGSKTAGLSGEETPAPSPRMPSSDTDDPETTKAGLSGQE